MPFRTALAVKFLVVGAALAQTPEDVLRSQIATARYAPLAEQARIQGDVHLKLNSGVVTVLSGHPLLAPIAVDSAKTFGPVQGRTELDVMYHFVLVDTSVPTSTIVKRGNALERAVLRMFGLKTEKSSLRMSRRHSASERRKGCGSSHRNLDLWRNSLSSDPSGDARS
jgi:hypothetical protein